MSFREYQGQITPPWLRGEAGEAWARAVGGVKDEFVDRAKQAVKARLPGLAPRDALQILGDERGVERLPGDSDEAYVARVSRVWEARRWAGTPRGLLEALAEIGYPTARLLIHRGIEYRLVDGEVQATALAADRWVMDGRPDFWSQFQVLLPAPHPWAADYFQDEPATTAATVIPGGTPQEWPQDVSVSVLSGGAVEGGAAVVRLYSSHSGLFSFDATVPPHGIVSFDEHEGTSGVEVTFRGTLAAGEYWAWTTGVFPDEASQDVERLRRVIRRWKPAFATCRGIVVHTAGALYGQEQRSFGSHLGVSASGNRVIWSV